MRRVRAVLTHHQEILGDSAEFLVPDDWRWDHVGPVCAALSAALGVPVAVLRVLDVDVAGRWGGSVRYHAEALARPAVRLARSRYGDELFAPHPLRSPWARGPELHDALDWAAAEVGATGPPEQVKSWNLGTVFRLPTADGTAWLKGLPSFGLREPDAIEAVADSGVVPAVLARRPGWMITAGRPGTVCWEPTPEVLGHLVTAWAGAAQAARRAPVVDLLPDRRPAVMPERLAALLDGEAGRELDADERRKARALLDDLPRIAAALAECGLPEGLVHGDFHPGNCVFDGVRASVLDFSDAHLGHPVIDGLRAAEYVDPSLTVRAYAAWCRSWRKAVPGCDPERALAVAPPLMRLSYADRYREFLAAIEPSERFYHEGDPAEMIREAIAAHAGAARR